MFMKKVLLATDFSRPSMQLIECLSEFITFGLSEVVLVHVIDTLSQGNASKAFRKFDEGIINSEKMHLEAMGLRVKSMVPIGNPAAEIVQIAQNEKASLIAIASHGKGIIKKIFLGSTTNDVIRTTTVPVLIEKYKDVDKETCKIICRNKLKRVLLPTDFSIHSQRVYERFLGFAHLVQEVVIVSVIEGASNDEELFLATQETDCRMFKMKQDLEQLGLKTKTILCKGSASAKIIETANYEKASLIMMATRGKGLIKELLLGTTAQEVARRSKQPLLLIPASRL